MSRQANDGRGRLGGRAKGTPNKSPEPLDKWLRGLVDRNRSKFESDLKECSPQERAAILSRIIPAVHPASAAGD